jgi:hypothetical protein
MGLDDRARERELAKWKTKAEKLLASRLFSDESIVAGVRGDWEGGSEPRRCSAIVRSRVAKRPRHRLASTVRKASERREAQAYCRRSIRSLAAVECLRGSCR